MRLTLHRSECAHYQGRDLVRAWFAHTFRPRPACQSASEGFSKLRAASVPVVVEAPVGSRLDPETGRLIVWFDPAGLDAESVAFLAREGKRGFSMVKHEKEGIPCS